MKKSRTLDTQRSFAVKFGKTKKSVLGETLPLDPLDTVKLPPMIKINTKTRRQDARSEEN